MAVPLNNLEKIALSVTRGIGSVASVIVHGFLFIGAFMLVFFGFDIGTKNQNVVKISFHKLEFYGVNAFRTNSNVSSIVFLLSLKGPPPKFLPSLSNRNKEYNGP